MGLEGAAPGRSTQHSSLERLALSRGTIDRAAHLRADPELLPRLLATPTTRVLPVRSGQAPALLGAGGLTLVTVAPPWVGSPLVFLGIGVAGVAYLAAQVQDEPPPLPGDASWVGLREAGAVLDDTGAGLLTGAVAVLGWHATHPRCARCGTVTDVVQAGWVRRCPQCRAEHYPRTDPAVIMAITDSADRLLLGRQASWEPQRLSVLAGFVEPGESLEAAVRREVLEESGVVVGEVSYAGSQPWPFPASLMLAFRGRAVSEGVTPDGEELAEVAWWSRGSVATAMAAGELVLPGPVSVARRLIEDWFGGPLQDGVASWR